MKHRKWFLLSSYPILILFLILLSFQKTGIAAEKTESKPENSVPEIIQIQPAKLQPDMARLNPGLSVFYIEKKFRHINDMPAEITAYSPGKSIQVLDHRFNGEEPVFDSDLARGVGMWITGWIQFSQSGQYDLMAKSNDGIRIWINEKQIIEEPDVHSDRYSPKASLAVVEPGYYPLKILYFQRKGTACIEMHWKEPGKTEFSIIPATAYFYNPVAGPKS